MHHPHKMYLVIDVSLKKMQVKYILTFLSSVTVNFLPALSAAIGHITGAGVCRVNGKELSGNMLQLC